MCRFESLQKVESRAQSADYSKSYRKPKAFKCTFARFKLELCNAIEQGRQKFYQGARRAMPDTPSFWGPPRNLYSLFL